MDFFEVHSRLELIQLNSLSRLAEFSFKGIEENEGDSVVGWKVEVYCNNRADSLHSETSKKNAI